MIKAMNHIGFSVANLERAIQFYQDQLGMQVVVPPTPFEGGQHEEIMALRAAKGKVALVSLPAAGLQLELFEFERPTPRHTDTQRPVCDHGITHFCIEVSDIEAEYARLNAAGVAFHCPPLLFKSGNKATYARDPDGNVFELWERAQKHRPAEAFPESKLG